MQSPTKRCAERGLCGRARRYPRRHERDGPSPNANPGAPRTEGSRLSLRILIIEDVPANMALTASILQGAGHAPMQATDALTGLEMARSGSPDLILMDIQLPGMDGLAATRLLKDDARTRNVPVVALTAYAMKGDEDRMRAAGCDGYVAKPIRYRELLAAIDAALPHG
ncbi:MAG: response regulator [Aquabacterium sp.]|nr:MAG: response regulator [Aquabacterium sp.]